MPHLPIGFLARREAEMLALLGELVNCESPSTEKPAVDVLGRRLTEILGGLPGTVETVPQVQAGDHLLYRWGGDERPLLMLCHMDTVFDLGTAAQRPFRVQGERAYGPGVLDMKAGIAMAVTALRALHEAPGGPGLPVQLLINSDEEIGSTSSRALIEELASQARAVLVLEPTTPSGAIKTSRKGVGDLRIETQGTAAHAGAAHAEGRNAIEELAHHILAAQALTDYSRGTTVNVGVIRGGTRSNVVPDAAEAEVDFRVTQMEEALRLEEWARSRTPQAAGCGVRVRYELNRPPMPRDTLMEVCYAKAFALAVQLGFFLNEEAVGGASDANFVAPLGVPVLDGLGAVGDGAHSDREYILVPSLAERTALLAALIQSWQE
mgnify:FL=1